MNNKSLVTYELLYEIFEEFNTVNNIKNKLIKNYKKKKIIKKLTDIINSIYISASIEAILNFINIIESKGVGYNPIKYDLRIILNTVTFNIKNDTIQKVEYDIKFGRFYVNFYDFWFSIDDDTNITNSIIKRRWDKEVVPILNKIIINTIIDMSRFSDFIVN